MKVLFALRSWANTHYYHSLIAALARRGYDIHLLFDSRWSAPDPQDALNVLLAEYPRITWGHLRRRGLTRPIIDVVRELRSYRRYLVVSGQSDYYRRRWRRYLPFVLKVFVRLPGVDALLRTQFVGRVCNWFERALPSAPRVVAHLRELHPDIVVSAPVNMRFSTEVEYVKAARALGIPTVIPAYSWDNLTTKGLLHVHPDRLLVWNEVQKEEALTHHGISEDSIRVVGASLFDKWFISRQLTPKEIFCNAHGLDPSRLFVVYLGSSRNIAPNEIWLIRNIRNALNASGLSHVQILARPHPANVRPYAELKESEAVVMLPGKGIPATQAAVQALYDALTHASVIIGINTSAMLDAVCLDRPVVSVLADTYKETQEDAAHFNALRASGAIVVVDTPEACARIVQDILSGVDVCKRNRAACIATWIRPRGLGRAAGEWAADEIGKLLT